MTIRTFTSANLLAEFTNELYLGLERQTALTNCPTVDALKDKLRHFDQYQGWIVVLQESILDIYFLPGEGEGTARMCRYYSEEYRDAFFEALLSMTEVHDAALVDLHGRASSVVNLGGPGVILGVGQDNVARVADYSAADLKAIADAISTCERVGETWDQRDGEEHTVSFSAHVPNPLVNEIMHGRFPISEPKHTAQRGTHRPEEGLSGVMGGGTLTNLNARLRRPVTRPGVDHMPDDMEDLDAAVKAANNLSRRRSVPTRALGEAELSSFRTHPNLSNAEVQSILDRGPDHNFHPVLDAHDWASPEEVEESQAAEGHDNEVMAPNVEVLVNHLKSLVAGYDADHQPLVVKVTFPGIEHTLTLEGSSLDVVSWMKAHQDHYDV